MKYSEKYVWQCVGKIVPEFLQAKEAGVTMSLPECLKFAACECWIHAEDADFRLNFDLQYAAYVIRVSLIELECIGYIAFGSQESF